ncbi:MAG: serine hydroxymethyltransferase [Candidatus Micrarchaeota archaeon]
MNSLSQTDTEIACAIRNEEKRQQDVLELIPSENIVSSAVLEALGSVFTNKYSEGYPGKRYYGGNEFTDVVEQLAIDRAKSLFGSEYANVQALSGSPANLAAYYAFMEHGDKFMAMSLSEGGHLTHGHKVNFSGKWFTPVHYRVDKETHLLDFDAIRKQAIEEKPKIILSGYTAYPRLIDFKAFKEIADEVGAICMSDIAHIAGLCCAGVHENPVPYYDVVTTTTHKTLRGPRGAIIFSNDEEKAKKIDKAVFPGLQGGPHENTIAAIAVALKEADSAEFKAYARQIVANAKALAEALMGEGFDLVTGGTDNHLMLVDLTKKGISGKQAERALDEAGITVNANTIPFDERKPWDPSGIRLGTPTLTTRGMREGEMKDVASFISRVIAAPVDASVKAKVKSEVVELCSRFPVE